jgi:hypothetical protein
MKHSKEGISETPPLTEEDKTYEVTIESSGNYEYWDGMKTSVGFFEAGSIIRMRK